MAGIFKAYDIRGIYGEILTDDMAFKIGRAIYAFLGCKTVVIGRDMRPHSKPLFDALARGLTLHGADVIDLGLCSTPMSYYANKRLGADASIMITASHNPGPWNGFKICRDNATPLSGATGILDLERIVQEEDFPPPAPAKGQISSHDIIPEYVDHFRAFADIRHPLNVVVDYANAVGILEAKVFEGLFAITPLFDTLDGTFPNHEANPLNTDTLVDAQQAVRAGKFDFAACFDGDADRVGFLDEKGDIIPMDMITALIARTLLATNPGANIFYDLRSSWAVKEIIEESGGIPNQSRVGHAFIKAQMREKDALFAGELSGHYYFKENSYAESSALAVLYIANLVSQSDKPLSELIAPIQRYFASGEINSTVEDAAAVLAKLRVKYADADLLELDGLSFEYPTWWFNVRSSNTEPLVRLNLEAKTEAEMKQRRDEVLALIRI
ncbi:MAG: phosphomannomutase/phosphoglucomutase [Kiritimatiellae bacterium]|jgi:phosphomannomutase|nr:phosphomannomutase/phosphoglucomutase [Kiritimatiellia bacterium]MDY0150031.1 phosphomannomutase/phosphoglucomutase [Kiritimatiellia bacterium]